MKLRHACAWLLGSLLIAAPFGSATAQPIPKPGTDMVPNEYGGEFPREITWEKDGSEMILIPHGTFVRGYEGGEAPERPEKEITLPSFYIDKHEISNDLYTQFLMESTSARPRPTNRRLLGGKLPVTAVPWTGASAYAEWAGKALPTEAMWEKAARGPEGHLYIGGNEIPDSTVVISGRGASGMTVPVSEDTGDVSGYGVLHMGGNVSEWTADWYARAYYDEDITENPMGPESGETRVYRGGNFFNPPADSRLTRRTGNPPSLFRDEIGFRTVWVPQPPVAEEDLPPPTPTPPPPPTNEEIVAAFQRELQSYVENDEPKLPRELMASRAHMSQGNENVMFVNFTPFPISVTFVGPNEELVFKYNEPLLPMAYRSVALPKGIDLFMLAYAKGAENPGLRNLGFLRSESKATVVVHTELFSPVVDEEGEAVEITEESVADQYYGEYNAPWNAVEIYNASGEQLVIKVEDSTVDANNPKMYGEFLVEPVQTLRLTLRPGAYIFSADYIGATEESGTPVEIEVNDRAARRLVTIRQDTESRGGVNVITKQMPFLLLDYSQARRTGSGGI